jgi:hypothetical protein
MTSNPPRNIDPKLVVVPFKMTVGFFPANDIELQRVLQRMFLGDTYVDTPLIEVRRCCDAQPTQQEHPVVPNADLLYIPKLIVFPHYLNAKFLRRPVWRCSLHSVLQCNIDAARTGHSAGVDSFR